MDTTAEITTLVSNVGFPIGAFILMWVTHNTTLKKLTDAIENLKDCITRERKNI
jgi:hypothetical protein